MQVVSSLLNLKSKYVKNPLVLESLRDTQDRVGSMALVHQKLHESPDLAEVDFAEYSRSLVTALHGSYQDSSQSISMQVSGDEVRLDIDLALPCGMILNELVSNSLKHAFSDQKEGKITIGLHAVTETQLRLAVSDNGKGFPEDLDFRNPDSLGLQLANSLTNQLNGTLELDGSEGTEFRLTFEKPKGKGVG